MLKPYLYTHTHEDILKNQVGCSKLFNNIIKMHMKIESDQYSYIYTRYNTKNWTKIPISMFMVKKFMLLSTMC